MTCETARFGKIWRWWACAKKTVFSSTCTGSNPWHHISFGGEVTGTTGALPSFFFCTSGDDRACTMGDADPSPVFEIREYYDASGKEVKTEKIDLQGTFRSSFASHPGLAESFEDDAAAGVARDSSERPSSSPASGALPLDHNAAMSRLDELIKAEEAEELAAALAQKAPPPKRTPVTSGARNAPPRNVPPWRRVGSVAFLHRPNRARKSLPRPRTRRQSMRFRQRRRCHRHGSRRPQRRRRRRRRHPKQRWRRQQQ